MDAQNNGTSREEIWRLQEALNELTAMQQQHSERIIRLEKRQEDGSRGRGAWGGSSPFPSGLSGSHHESTLNPAAEAFRNFDAEPPNAMISSLTLDHNDDPRRAAASRANSVRFDESANNHYGPSRSSIDLPTRTGSGLGSHPLSERSLSHRSERGSTSGFGRTNSFGLESSRLLGSIHNSPRVSGNPPPAFFVLGPCPAIIRCWLTETFSNDSLLYAAVCSGSSFSSISSSLLHRLGLSDSIIEENGLRKVKLLVYLTEAKIQIPSSRSASPAPQVPTITTKFVIYDHQPSQDKSVQIVLGTDVLRERTADVLLSQDKIVLFDDDRNQISVPMVRPEDDAMFKSLSTRPLSPSSSIVSDIPPTDVSTNHPTPGIIGRPGRVNSQQPISPTADQPLSLTINTEMQGNGHGELPTTSAVDLVNVRPGEDSKSTTESEKSATTPGNKPGSRVWSTSWRPAAGTPGTEFSNALRNPSSSSYSRPSTTRPMKVLRPLAAKGMASATRTPSATSPFTNGPDLGGENQPSEVSTTDPKTASSATESKSAGAKSIPTVGGSAFPWLAQSQPSVQRSTPMK